MPQGPRHVFVYGTLRRGECNDINRLSPPPVFVGTAEVPGRLFHLGGYPGLALGAGGPVKGEVYAIEPALEVVLDRIEEVHPQATGEYAKREIVVAVNGLQLPCLVYEIAPERTQGRPTIDGGDWLART